MLNPPKGQGLEGLVSEDFARQYGVLPLARHLNSLTVACVNPLNIITMDNLSRLTGCEINPVVTTRQDLESAIDAFYGAGSMLKAAIDRSYHLAEGQEQPILEEGSLDQLKRAAEEPPVIRLVDLVVREAVRRRASDIHLEPFNDTITLRYRIDGKLYEIAPPAKALHAALVSRVKILCKMDIAEKRLPQDGGFTMRLDQQTVDFRVSTVPTIYGEKVAIRLLQKSPELLQLGHLGFTERELEIFRKAVHQPMGFILIAGPTGSGKTTTLYAVLNEIRSQAMNLMTVEDPVEYRLEGVNQVQIRPSIGLTFASGLRAFLRQDPDVIMVGEVRDQETAEICVRAALTGHLVLTTVHTNDAPSAVIRFIEIGLPTYLLSSTLSVVCAQRLLRRLCESCREAFEPLPEIRKRYGIQEELLYRHKGCEKCEQTGYLGRVGVYEVMSMTRPLRDLIAKGVSTHELREAAVQSGMAGLWDAGLRKVCAGVTSLEELESVVILEPE